MNVWTCPGCRVPGWPPGCAGKGEEGEEGGRREEEKREEKDCRKPLMDFAGSRTL